MVLGWLLTALVLFAIGFACFALGKRQGWFDEPTLQRVEDARILENFRDASSGSLDAAAHDGHLYISQKYGQLQRYHPLARTWASIDAELPGLKNQDFFVLRSGNGGGEGIGADAESSGNANASDAAKIGAADRPLWGLTRGQGLAALHRDQWKTIAGDQAFIDGNGIPVQQEMLTCAAISDDQRYALFGTAAQGVGVFDRRTKQWSYPTSLRHSRISQAVFWKGMFWVAREKGLYSVEVDWRAKDQESEVVATRVDGINIAVLDIDVSPSGALHLLGRVAGGGASIVSLKSPDAPPETLLNEGLVTPDLELRDIHLAFQPHDTLWLAGDAGLFSYETGSHTWKRHAQQPVSRGVVSEEGTMFFGVPGQVVAVDHDDNVSKVKIPGRNRIQDLSASPHGYALALTASNRLFEVGADGGGSYEWFKGRATTLSPGKAFAAVAHRSKVLFATENGIVVHDIIARSYADYPVKSVAPEAICDANLRYHLSYPTLYITRDNGTSVKTYSIPFENALTGNFSTLHKNIPAIPLSSPVREFIPWQNDLLCVSEDGSMVRFSPHTFSKVGHSNGVPPEDLAELVDVAQVGNLFHLATETEIHTYDLGLRAWRSDPVFNNRQMQPIGELGSAFGGLAIVHDDQSVTVRTYDKQTGSPMLSRLFSGNPELDDRDIVDVQPSLHRLHVATRDGRVCRYDRIRRNWNELSLGKGPVDLVGSVSATPLAVCDGKLFLGDREIEAGDGPVHRAFEQGGNLWAIRGKGASRKLFVYHQTNPGNRAVTKQVFFDSSRAGAFKLSDVVSLAPVTDGVVVRTTKDELHHYSVDQRRWQKLEVPKCSALFYQGSELFFVFERSNGAKLLYHEVGNPPSRSSKRKLEGVLGAVLDVEQVGGGDIYVLEEDGTILRLREGVGPQTVLPGPAPGVDKPPEKNAFDHLLRQPHDRQLRLVASKGDQVWRYNGSSWTTLRHNFSSAEAIRLATPEDPFATASYADGTFSAARVGTRGLEGNWPVYRYYKPTLPKDVELRGAWQSADRWAFLDDKGGFHRLNPTSRRWDPMIKNAPSNAPATLQLARAGGIWLFYEPGSNEAHMHIAGQERTFKKLTLDSSMPLVLMADGRFRRIRNGQYEQSNLPDAAGYPTFAPTARSGTYSFRVGRDGELELADAGGRRAATFAAADEFAMVGPAANSPALPTLNAGWVAWNAGTERFILATPDGKGVALTAAQFARDGHLLPEEVSDILVHGPTRVSVLTPKGVFVHRDILLPLTDRKITFQPLRVGKARFASGQLVSEDGRTRYAFNGRVWTPNAPAKSDPFGGVVIDRSASDARLATRDGKSALGPEGFQRDRRLSLTAVGNTVWINTSAGSHTLSNPADLQARPPAGTQALEMDFSDSFWQWQFKSEGLEVSIPSVPTLLRRGAPDFPFNEIIDAAEYRGMSYVLTPAGLERMNSTAGFGQPQIFPIRGGKAIETFTTGTGKMLCVRTDKGLFQFDGNKFSPTSRPSPEVLYQDQRLQFVRRANGQIDKYLMLDSARKPPTVGSPNLKMLFRMSDGRFPFDRVNDLIEVNNHVYIATEAGLEVHFDEVDFQRGLPAPMVLSLDSARRMWHLDSSNASPKPVEAISPVPTVDPDDVKVRVQAGGGTWQAERDREVKAINRRPLDRDSELRFRNGFWEWRRVQGKVVGEYRAKGAAGLPVRLVPGRDGPMFEHEIIVDAGIYDGSSFLLWENGFVSMIPGGDLGLSNPYIVNEDWSQIQPQRFIRLVDPARPDGGIRQALFLEGRRGDLHEYNPQRQSFVRVTDPDRVDLIRAENERKLVYQDKRLRLHPPRQSGQRRGPQFELYASTGWTALPWHPDGVLGIDRFDAVAATAEGCWAVTRSGLLHLDRPTAAETLQPFSGRLRPLPKLQREDGSPGAITDLGVQGGHLYLRQDNQTNRVWRTTAAPSAADSLVSPWPEDPFSERVWVDTSEWQWRQVGTHSGKRGWITATWRGQDLQLVGGRFPFDTINSIAFFNERIEIGTDHGGWLQSEEGSMALGDLLRPEVPGVDAAAVRGVRIVAGAEGGEVELGLVRDKDVLRLSKDNVLRETKDAPALQFDDGFWTAVRRGDGKLDIYSERGAPISRLLVNGRFDDQRVTGLPITSRDDDGVYTLLPTEGGLLRLGSDLQAERVVLPPEELPPRPILILDRAGEPMLLSPTNAVPLDPERPGMSIPLLAGKPLYAEHAPLDLIRVFTASEGETQQTLLRLGAEREVADVEHLLPLSASDQVASGGDETAVLGVAVRDNMVLFRFPGEERGLAYTYEPTQILRSVMTDRHLFLLSKSDLWVVDVERAKAQTLERRQEIGRP